MRGGWDEATEGNKKQKRQKNNIYNEREKKDNDSLTTTLPAYVFGIIPTKNYNNLGFETARFNPAFLINNASYHECVGKYEALLKAGVAKDALTLIHLEGDISYNRPFVLLYDSGSTRNLISETCLATLREISDRTGTDLQVQPTTRIDLQGVFGGTAYSDTKVTIAFEVGSQHPLSGPVDFCVITSQSPLLTDFIVSSHTTVDFLKTLGSRTDPSIHLMIGDNDPQRTLIYASSFAPSDARDPLDDLDEDSLDARLQPAAAPIITTTTDAQENYDILQPALRRLKALTCMQLGPDGGFTNVQPYGDVTFDEQAAARLKHVRYGHAPRNQVRSTALETLERLISANVIKRVFSSSCGSSPMRMIPKPNDPTSLRMISDFRHLNDVVINKASLGMHTYLNFIDVMTGANVFVVFDLVEAFHQSPIAEHVAKKLVFNYADQLYQFLRAPQGFCLSSSILKSHLDFIFEGLIARPKSGLLIYADDLFAYAQSVQDMKDLLEEIATRCEFHNVKLKAGKIQEPSNKVLWNSLEVSKDGVRMQIRNESQPFPDLPTNASELTTQLGVANYHSAYVPELAYKRAPLQKILHDSMARVHGSSRKRDLQRIKLEPTEELKEGHHAMWTAIANRPRIYHLREHDVRVVISDASQIGWAFTTFRCALTVWEQFKSGEADFQTLPLDLMLCQSGRFSASEFNWDIGRKEFYAVVEGLRSSPFFGWDDQPINIFVDNKDIYHWFKPTTSSSLSPQNITWALRWLQYIHSTPFNVWHNPGQSVTHFLADMLSRDPPMTVREANIGAATSTDLQAASPVMSVIDTIVSNNDHNALGLSEATALDFSTSLLESAAPESKRDSGLFHKERGIWRETASSRILAPAKARRPLMVLAHSRDSGHRGVYSTTTVLKRHFVWDTLDTDVSAFIAHCIHCQMSRDGPSEHVPYGMVKQGTHFNDVLHLDHAAMPASSDGETDVLVLVDDYSKLTMLIAVKSVSADATFDAIRSRWIPIFGAPKTFVTDNGPAFRSAFFLSQCRLLGTKIHRTLPNVPQTHGTVERLIRDARAVIEKLRLEHRLPHGQWPLILPGVMSALNHMPVQRLGGHSPVEMLCGRAVDPISRLRSSIDPDQPFSHDVSTSITDLSEAVAVIHQHAEEARLRRKQRQDAAQAKRAGTDVPSVFAPGIFVLVASATPSPGLSRRPTWSTLGQIVARINAWTYTYRNVLNPTRLHTSHVMFLRFFEEADFIMPPQLRNAFEHASDTHRPFDEFLDLRKVHNTFQVETAWSDGDITWENVGPMVQDAPTAFRDFLRRRRETEPKDKIVAGILAKYRHIDLGRGGNVAPVTDGYSAPSANGAPRRPNGRLLPPKED